MSRWDRLSMGDRAALVSLFVNNGVFDPKEMRRIYDEGGDVKDIKPAVVEASYPRERDVLDLVNNSKADFVARLKDVNRLTIPDWEGDGDVATHKLGYAEVDGKYVVYPLVQNIDGKLYDFSDPQYGMDKSWQALDSALYAGDYVELPSEADARWFTESYKRHYPGFNKYQTGGGKKGAAVPVDAISGADSPAVDTDPQKSKTAWFDWWYKYRDDQIDNLRKAKAEYLTSKKRFNKGITNYVSGRINGVTEAYNDVYRDAKSIPEHIVSASMDSTSRRQAVDFGKELGRDGYESSAKALDILTEGLYTPYYHNIIYSLDYDGKIPSDVMVHERTHTLRNNPYYPVFQDENAKYIKSGDSYLVKDTEKDKYLDSYSEIYARLNAFRYANKLNPSHTYSKEEIGRFRSDGLLERYDLDRYTDDYLYFLFNGLADSSESVSGGSDVNSAALGGLFNRYDGKTEKSQMMVRLGENDYLVPRELSPAVVVADNAKPKVEIPFDYLFLEEAGADRKLDTLRDVMQSVIDREKMRQTSVDILKGYRSAYDNPFLANPYYRNYINYGYNRFDDGSDDSENNFDTVVIRQGKKWSAFDRWASNHPQAMMRLRKAKTLVGDALALHPVLGIYDDIKDIITSKNPYDRNISEEINAVTTSTGLAGKAGNLIYGSALRKVFGDNELSDAFIKASNVLNVPDKINDSVKFIKDFATPVEEFANGGDTDGSTDTINPSVVSAGMKGMSKKQIRRNSRIVRTVLGNLGENGVYTPEQKKRMAEYIIRTQGGLPNPSIPRVIEMRKGLKYKNKDGISGLERVLYGDEKIKDIIDSINSDHISYDDDGARVVRGFSLYNYNGNLMNTDERYDNDIVDAYINSVAPYGGKEYASQYNLGPYKNYLDKYYKGKNIKSYIFGESELPEETIERLDRYAYERGDNSFVVGTNTDKGVGFHLRGNKNIPDGVDFDAAGHLWQFIKDDDGKFYVRQSDSYDFEPNQYRETYGDTPYITDALSALESAGNPVLVFNPWKEADDLDLSELTRGNVLVDDIDEDAIKKAIEYNKQRKNGKFLNAIDNALTLMYSVTR